jgi:PAS domain S-box-containing protein
MLVKLNLYEKLIFSSGVLNKGSSLVIATNRAGDITFISENVKTLLGYEPEEVMGQRWWKATTTDQEELTHLKEETLKSFKDGKSYIRKVKAKSGEIRYIQWVDKRFSSQLLVGIGQDVTDQVALQKRYEYLVENAEDAIYTSDYKGNFTLVNNRLEKITGYSAQELIGRNYIDFIHESEKDRVHAFYQNQFIERIETTYLELPFVTRTGEITWIGQHVKILFNEKDKHKIDGFLSVARDITQKKKADDLIRQQNMDITDSIIYANNIQRAMLQSEDNFNTAVSESFLLYHPRDIVSGDFYWTQRVDDRLVIVVGDCTGHGVPAAFLTILGINQLKSIVSDQRITSPAEILKKLDEGFATSLSKYETNAVKDGMDLAICEINFNEQHVCFAGARMPMVCLRDQEVRIFRGARKSIGDLSIHNVEFTAEKIYYTKEDTFYMFSDGYQDQFGGPRNKKYSSKRLINSLKQIQHIPLEFQKQLLVDEHEAWRVDTPQTDDIIAIGFKPYRAES